MLILNLLPLYFIVFSANLVPSSRVWRWITIGSILLLNGVLFLVGLAVLAAGPSVMQEMLQAELVDPEVMGLNLAWAGGLVLITAVVSTLLLVPPIRAAVIRGLRFDLEVDKTIHTTALVFATWLVGLTVAQVFLLADLPVELIAGQTELTLGALWEQGLAFVLFGILGVGLGLRRSLGETLERLGITGMTWRQVGIALAAVVILLLWDFLLTTVWQAIAPGSFERIAEISELLFGDVMGLFGALTIGLSAGIGEEVLFRGAIQPRFGLLAATILFTVGHTQYEFSPALFSVFLIGLVLGIIRQRENTTTVILIHAAYNALNVLLAPLWT